MTKSNIFYPDQFQRRQFLQQSVAAATIWSIIPNSLRSESHETNDLKLASFSADVTPPEGHPLCGGWITPVVGVTDTLDAHGIVLLGAGKPIVICAVDWTGILNESHVLWRTEIAKAVGTTPERVAVHCVHQHNAPFACLDADRITQAEGDLPHIVEPEYFHQCLSKVVAAVKGSLNKAKPVTHVGHGESEVDRVASNRRIYRDENGVIKAMRGSSCKDPKLRAMTEGTIDRMLKVVTFHNNEERLATLHYYATHPMSYYGDGLVSSDFVGIARKRRQEEDSGCHHIYFTGASGNVSAGKYNDGSKPVRAELADRMYQAMLKAEEAVVKTPVSKVGWRTVEILPAARNTLVKDVIQSGISNKSNSVVNRNRPSYMLAWLNRLEKKIPIVLSSLALNDISLLHLPAESFVEYQLRAQKMAKDRFVATAAYGDGGPWYIPIKEEYPAQGYEVRVAFCEPTVDDVMTEGISKLLEVK